MVWICEPRGAIVKVACDVQNTISIMFDTDFASTLLILAVPQDAVLR